jgi:hypothetical protein
MLKRFGMWILYGLLALFCFPFVLIILLSALLYVMAMPLGWLIAEFSGEAEWFRNQRRRMVDERPPLPDADLIQSEAVGAKDAPLWIAVRGAVAESLGIPRESIYPEDQLADIWRMLAPLDLLDLIFAHGTFAGCEDWPEADRTLLL